MLPIAVGRARRGDREPDRLEREGQPFFARIDAGYRTLARSAPERVRVLDASLSAAELAEAALAEITDLWAGIGRPGRLRSEG